MDKRETRPYRYKPRNVVSSKSKLNHRGKIVTREIDEFTTKKHDVMPESLLQELEFYKATGLLGSKYLPVMNVLGHCRR